MRRLTVTALIAITLLSSTAIAQAPGRSVIVARIDSIAKATVATSSVGLQVTVIRGHDTLLMKGYGMANVELGVPMTPDHVLRIGSLTKQFTSSAIMQLVEQGAVRVDDPLSKYVANTPPAWSAIKVSHLLGHMSGVQSYTEILSIRRTLDYMGVPRDTMAQIMARAPMLFEPGTGFMYSNGGYYLLGMIIEKASGLSYGDYIAKMMAPLGLQHTMYCDTGPIIPGRAAGYNRRPTGDYTNANYVDMSTPYSAGALCSTTRELAKWSDALVSGRVVKPATFREMTTPVRYPSIRRGSYGMGLNSDSIGGHFLVSHTGGINGFSSVLLHAPADSVIVAVIGNTSTAPAPEIARRMLRIVLGLPETPATLLDLPVSEAERRAMIGRYRATLPDGTQGEITIADDSGRLSLRLQRAPQSMPLYRQSPEVFAVPGQDGLKVWVDMRDGVVREIIFDRANRPLVGRPVR